MKAALSESIETPIHQYPSGVRAPTTGGHRARRPWFGRDLLHLLNGRRRASPRVRRSAKSLFEYARDVFVVGDHATVTRNVGAIVVHHTVFGCALLSDWGQARAHIYVLCWLSGVKTYCADSCRLRKGAWSASAMRPGTRHNRTYASQGT